MKIRFPDGRTYHDVKAMVPGQPETAVPVEQLMRDMTQAEQGLIHLWSTGHLEVRGRRGGPKARQKVIDPFKLRRLDTLISLQLIDLAIMMIDGVVYYDVMVRKAPA
jgi:hypothetical protein